MLTVRVLGMKLRLAPVAGVLLAIAVATVPAAQESATVARPPADYGPPADIVIQGAVDSELQPLLAGADRQGGRSRSQPGRSGEGAWAGSASSSRERKSGP